MTDASNIKILYFLWLALGLTIGTLAIWTPTVVQAEESTDAVITEEVQDSEHEEATPDAPSTEDKMMEEAPEAPVQNATEDNTDITEDIYLPDNDAADVQLYTEQGAGSWRQTNGRWWFRFNDGKLHFGWFKADTKWYYAKPQNGIILSNTIQKIDGQKYRFDSDVAMHVGWYNDILSADDWYYFDANGMGHEGWLAHKGAWYYFIEGEMVRDAIIQTDSQFSRFGSDGKWLGYAKPLT